jgi:hypothetical protein
VQSISGLVQTASTQIRLRHDITLQWGKLLKDIPDTDILGLDGFGSACSFRGDTRGFIEEMAKVVEVVS